MKMLTLDAALWVEVEGEDLGYIQEICIMTSNRIC